MSSKRVCITIPEDLLQDLDTITRIDHTNRSAYIREALRLKMNLDAYTESEVTDRESFTNLMRKIHFGRTIRRDIRKAGPLTYLQAQD